MIRIPYICALVFTLTSPHVPIQAVSPGAVTHWPSLCFIAAMATQ